MQSRQLTECDRCRSTVDDCATPEARQHTWHCMALRCAYARTLSTAGAHREDALGPAEEMILHSRLSATRYCHHHRDRSSSLLPVCQTNTHPTCGHCRTPPVPHPSIFSDMPNVSATGLSNKHPFLLAAVGHLCFNFETRGEGFMHGKQKRHRAVYFVHTGITIMSSTLVAFPSLDCCREHCFQQANIENTTKLADVQGSQKARRSQRTSL